MKNGNRPEGAYRDYFARISRHLKYFIAVAFATITFSGTAQACSWWDAGCHYREVQNRIRAEADRARQEAERARQEAERAAAVARAAAEAAAAEAERLAAEAQALAIQNTKDRILSLIPKVNGVRLDIFLQGLENKYQGKAGELIPKYMLDIINSIEQPKSKITDLIYKIHNKRYIPVGDDSFIMGNIDTKDQKQITELKSNKYNTLAKNYNILKYYTNNDDYGGADVDQEKTSTYAPRQTWAFSLPIEAQVDLNFPARPPYVPPTKILLRASFPLVQVSQIGLEKGPINYTYVDKDFFYVQLAMEVGPRSKTPLIGGEAAFEVNTTMKCRSNGPGACQIQTIQTRGQVDYDVGLKKAFEELKKAKPTIDTACRFLLGLGAALPFVDGFGAYLGASEGIENAFTRAAALSAEDLLAFDSAVVPQLEVARHLLDVQPELEEMGTNIARESMMAEESLLFEDVYPELSEINRIGNVGRGEADPLIADPIAAELRDFNRYRQPGENMRNFAQRTRMRTADRDVLNQISTEFETEQEGFHTQIFPPAEVGEIQTGFIFVNPDSLDDTQFRLGYSVHESPDVFRVNIVFAQFYRAFYNRGNQSLFNSQPSQRIQVRVAPAIAIAPIVIPLTTLGKRILPFYK